MRLLLRRFIITLNVVSVIGITLEVIAGAPPGMMLWALPAMAVIAARNRLMAVSPPAPAPPPEIREARHPEPLPAKQKGVTCRICGMDDPQRFRVGIGVAQWRGWPVHDTCAEWLKGGPKSPPRPGPAREGARIFESEIVQVYAPSSPSEELHRRAEAIRAAQQALATVAHAGTAVAMDAPRYLPLLHWRDWDDPPF